jgi:hypothetical protein
MVAARVKSAEEAPKLRNFTVNDLSIMTSFATPVRAERWRGLLFEN